MKQAFQTLGRLALIASAFGLLASGLVQALEAFASSSPTEAAEHGALWLAQWVGAVGASLRTFGAFGATVQPPSGNGPGGGTGGTISDRPPLFDREPPRLWSEGD